MRTLQLVLTAHARPKLIDRRASVARCVRGGGGRNIDKCYCDTGEVLSNGTWTIVVAAAVRGSEKKPREGCTARGPVNQSDHRVSWF